jgi:hypothetical protein
MFELDQIGQGVLWSEEARRLQAREVSRLFSRLFGRRDAKKAG